ncbi:MAG: hypothetical protein CO013_09275 [Syntrophobacterales bacterium CG_4_8_14_3_um_filter_58_8]|nr:MAG: hypothetical protein CO013_09275 [Syntrophobacterales bacterium CG_4_8_14_3_um_filter_58_8]
MVASLDLLLRVIDHALGKIEAEQGVGAVPGQATALAAIADFASVKWQDCPAGWQAPFRPAGKGDYFDWPLLTDLMPWQHSGIECKRTWPIAPDDETLKQRWRALLSAEDRGAMFRETGDRMVSGTYDIILTAGASSKPIAQIPKNAPVPPIHTCGFRSFDRQKIIADARLMPRPRPDLWRVHGPKQLFLASSVVLELGSGPAITSSSHIPDLHYFAGRGGKDILPLYRNAGATEANIPPGLLDLLSTAYRLRVTPEDFLAYGVLAQPAFTARHAKELETRELRLPLTKDFALFAKVRDIGARLLWLHTYGERFVPRGRQRGQIPPRAAKCIKAVPGEPDGYPESFDYNDATRKLRVGEGEFHPVSPEAFEFEVSGFKVVQSWLRYRMRKGAGKKSSPLDDIRPERWTSRFTTELLELLWVLEATVAGYPEQEKLLEAVIDGPCFRADEFPPVPDAMRKPPAAGLSNGHLFED